MEFFTYKDECGVCVLSHLKQASSLATDKQIWVISNFKQLYTKKLKNTKPFKIKTFCMHCYIHTYIMWSLVDVF